MNCRQLLPLAAIFPSLLTAQQINTTDNRTSGPCSPIADKNSGIINIRCAGLTPEQSKLLQSLPATINKVLKDEPADTDAILEAIRSCIEGVKIIKDISTPRHISQEQVDALTKELAILAGQKIIVENYMMTPETSDFGHEVIAALKIAGMDVDPRGVAGSSRPISGCEMRAEADQKRGASFVADALVKVKICPSPVTIRISPKTEGLTLTVGFKPPLP